MGKEITNESVFRCYIKSMENSRNVKRVSKERVYESVLWVDHEKTVLIQCKNMRKSSNMRKL